MYTFSLATLHGSWDSSSPTRDLNPSPQQVQCRIPTTEQTGNSLYTFFFFAALGLCYSVWALLGLWGLYSLTRDWTHILCIRRQILSHTGKSHPVYFKWMNCMVCALYLNFLITSLFEIKYDLNKPRARSFSWTRSLNIINISILLKLIARFNTILIQKSQSFSPEITKLILKCIWRCKGKAIDIKKIN